MVYEGWEYKMPRAEHPEMHNPWFWPFGLKLYVCGDPMKVIGH